MMPARNPLRAKDTRGLKVRRCKKIFHANGNNKKAVLISDKTDFTTKAIRKIKNTVKNKWINTRRGYYTDQHICIQLRSTQIYKTNTNRYKGLN